MSRARLWLALLLTSCVPTSPDEEAPPLEARLARAVVGGTEAPEDAAVVALVARRTRCAGESLTLLCTGALLAPDVVLTAAHCLDLFGPEGPRYEVFLGPQVLPEPRGRFVRVAEAVRHPGYVASTHAFDAALLRLAAPVEVPPLRLPLAGWGALEEGQAARVVGFGDTRDASAPAGVRREGGLVVTEVEESAFRAGPAPAMSCVGDSGGPVLVRGGDGEEVLAGLTASGDVACRTEAFNVRVDALLEDFVKPFLARGARTPGPVLAPESLCTAPCTRDAECPSGLLCVPPAEGAPGRCLQPALWDGDYGAPCAEDAHCGTGGLCARLEPEGEAACRCFTPCGQTPLVEARGCSGAPGPGGLAWLAVGGGLLCLSRRGGAGASSARRGG